MYLASTPTIRPCRPAGPSQMIAQSRFQLGSNAIGSADRVKPLTRRSASVKSRSSASLITDPISAPVSRSASLGSMRCSDMAQRPEQANHLVPFLTGRQAAQLPQAVKYRLAKRQLFQGLPCSGPSGFAALCLPEPEQSLRDRKAFRPGVEPVPVGLYVVRLATVVGRQAANEKLPLRQGELRPKVAQPASARPRRWAQPVRGLANEAAWAAVSGEAPSARSGWITARSAAITASSSLSSGVPSLAWMASASWARPISIKSRTNSSAHSLELTPNSRRCPATSIAEAASRAGEADEPARNKHARGAGDFRAYFPL